MEPTVFKVGFPSSRLPFSAKRRPLFTDHSKLRNLFISSTMNRLLIEKHSSLGSNP